MHILIDAINANKHPRGPDRYLLALLRELAKLDTKHRYTVCHAPWQEAYEGIELPDTFTRVCLHPPQSPTLRTLWHAIRFPRLAAALEPDLVFLPNLIFAPMLGCPSVMTVHDLAHFRFPEKFGPLRGRLLRALIYADFRVADRVISVSKFTTNDIRRFIGYSDSRIHQIAEGGPEPTPPQPTKQDPPYFLYVGQLERSKNIEALIKAFCNSDALAKKDVELMIAGNPGNAATDIQKAITPSGSRRIKLLGYVDDRTLGELYGRCLGLVFPSLVEGFGLVLLEAMAHGAPVIAMRTGVMPEVVGDAGLLVNTDQEDGLQSAMEKLLGDPECRKRLRDRGYKRLARFSWAKAARESLDVFELTATETGA